MPGRDRQNSFEKATRKYFRRRYLVVGMVLFATISAAGVAAGFLMSSGAAILPTLRQMSPPLLLALAGLVVTDWLLGGYRLFIFAHAMVPGVSFRDAFRANLANMFLGAITPMQTGGGPAHVYILWRAGLPVTGGIALSVIGFVATLFVLLLAAIFVALATPGEFPATLRVALQYAFLAFSGLLALLLVLLLAPRLLLDPLARLPGQFSRLLGRTAPEATARWQARLMGLVEEWRQAVQVCSKGNPHLLVLNLGITLALYFNKCLIGYVLARAMGMVAPFVSVIGAQALLLFVCYFAPSPGASFVAEVSNTYLMGWISGPEKIAVFTALVRISTLWLAVVLGGIFLHNQLRRDTRDLIRRDGEPDPGAGTGGESG